MPTLTIKGMPDPLYHRLKQRAAEHRRSLNSEILVCLDQAVAVAVVDPQAALARADSVRHRIQQLHVPRLTDAGLRAAKASGRP
ncbi:MAG: FitA-like ribbon-helix-helix domain-containing protein [Gemmatimonadaceae bacterium]